MAFVISVTNGAETDKKAADLDPLSKATPCGCDASKLFSTPREAAPTAGPAGLYRGIGPTPFLITPAYQRTMERKLHQALARGARAEAVANGVDRTMNERTTSKLFGFSLATVFLGMLVLNAVSF